MEEISGSMSLDGFRPGLALILNAKRVLSPPQRNESSFLLWRLAVLALVKLVATFESVTSISGN